jgi:hypothetical protein
MGILLPICPTFLLKTGLSLQYFQSVQGFHCVSPTIVLPETSFLTHHKHYYRPTFYLCLSPHSISTVEDNITKLRLETRTVNLLIQRKVSFHDVRSVPLIQQPCLPFMSQCKLLDLKKRCQAFPSIENSIPGVSPSLRYSRDRVRFSST